MLHVLVSLKYTLLNWQLFLSWNICIYCLSKKSWPNFKSNLIYIKWVKTSWTYSMIELVSFFGLIFITFFRLPAFASSTSSLFPETAVAAARLSTPILLIEKKIPNTSFRRRRNVYSHISGYWIYFIAWNVRW